MNTEAKDRLRSDRDEMVRALTDAGAEVRGTSLKCPFHEDRSPSGSIYQGDDGAWRFKCMAASCGFHGDVFDVRSRVTGRPVEDLLIELNPPTPKSAPAKEPPREYATIDDFVASFRHVAATYRYTHPETLRVELIKLRIEPPGERKRFIQAHIGRNGKVVATAPPKPWPIYNRARVIAASEIVVVEGEKCVHALHSANVVATCCSGGGGKGAASHTDWRPLRGKTVFLWPDHDPVNADGTRGGHEHMREVAQILKQLDCRIFWINPDDLQMGEKEDAADFVDRFDAQSIGDAISDAFDLAKPMGASAGVGRFLQDAEDGKRIAVPLPFSRLAHLTKALQPGCVTLLVGEEGSSKSLLTMQMVTWWAAHSIKCSAYLLEDDIEYHLTRVLAQEAGCADITDPDWVREHSAEWKAIYTAHSPTLDVVGRMLDHAPEEVLTLDQILTWMQRVTDAGARIVIVDPVTACDAGKNIWDSEKAFMAKAKTILRRSGASLILVTHPKEAITKGLPRLDQIAGSRAYPRFAQTVWWLSTVHNPDVKRRISTAMGEMHQYADRIIHLLKVRNGRGAKLRIAYRFNKNALTFDEVGVDLGPVRTKQEDGLSNEDIPL